MTRWKFVLFALLGLMFVACDVPSQHDPVTYGTTTVAFGPSVDGSDQDWIPDQVNAMKAELAEMSALGPDWVVGNEGSADVVVRPFDAHYCMAGAGAYHPGSDFVEIDPDARCTPGFDSLRRAMAHELIHWWTYKHAGWTGHICAHPGDRTDCHPTVFCSDCLLSPNLSSNADFDVVEEDFVASQFVNYDPQPEDLRLFQLCLRPGCR